MGARGPLPQLQVVRDHRGNPGHRTTPETAKPALLPLQPTPPRWLDPAAQYKWRQMVEALDGLVFAADGPTLELCLAHYAMARRCAAEIAELKELNEWDGAHERHKVTGLVRAFNAQSDAFLKYAQQLGMTVAARVRMPLRPEETDGGDGLFD